MSMKEEVSLDVGQGMTSLKNMMQMRIMITLWKRLSQVIIFVPSDEDEDKGEYNLLTLLYSNF